MIPSSMAARKPKSKTGLMVVSVILLLLAALGGGGWYAVSSGMLSLDFLTAGDATLNLTPEEYALLEQQRIDAMYEAANYIEWPMIELTGMVAIDEPSKQSAILNGHLIKLQQTIDDARLIEVRQNGAVLEYRETRKIIRVGEST